MFAEEQTVLNIAIYERSSRLDSPYMCARYCTRLEVKLVHYCQRIVNKCQLTFCATHPITKSRYVVIKAWAPSDVTPLIFL